MGVFPSFSNPEHSLAPFQNPQAFEISGIKQRLKEGFCNARFHCQQACSWDRSTKVHPECLAKGIWSSGKKAGYMLRD